MTPPARCRYSRSLRVSVRGTKDRSQGCPYMARMKGKQQKQQGRRWKGQKGTRSRLQRMRNAMQIRNSQSQGKKLLISAGRDPHSRNGPLKHYHTYRPHPRLGRESQVSLRWRAQCVCPLARHQPSIDRDPRRAWDSGRGLLASAQLHLTWLSTRPLCQRVEGLSVRESAKLLRKLPSLRLVCRHRHRSGCKGRATQRCRMLPETVKLHPNRCSAVRPIPRGHRSRGRP